MLPLAGRRILVTRSRQQASELAAQLEALGATTSVIPTIEIAAPASYDALDEASLQLSLYDWLIFTSANAVNVFCERTTIRDTPRIAVIGPSTARVAQAAGLPVDLIPKQAVAESLLESLLPHIQTGTRVLLVRAEVARNELPNALTHAGAEVTIAEAYRTVIPSGSVEALRHLFATHPPDAVTFTSSSTATNLVALLEAGGMTLPPTIVRASIGPITSQTLRVLGLPPSIEAATATTASLAQALADYFSTC
ncbi:uroporphyrinogen-III synthase [Granulicella pectinivorans]|uniref:Uroporphyrinogen-III synthase n=1 Tax=Granulicella pectinivorans TaxID=474950 RepID=A0A1I6MHH5_9BACT|nr:uroporphyrinogen-III synthase [Granulicella pectinivorans]SFS15109.1 uroporphyrinogen-III synthase [Granulicella pectinivorans]